VFEPELITTEDRLTQLASLLLQKPAVAVDTEFFWERTFYPILGLVQLAAEDGCWLIDAVRLRDLRPLGPVLAAPGVTKVLHDAPQDLGILARASGALPRTVFDTRLAAGFAGLSSTGSLQTLVRETQGIELAKAETRSDWLRRPLSANQIRYAAEDVLYLLSARDVLLARCAGDVERDWLTQDLARLDDPAIYRDRDPQSMYLRVKGAANLAPRQLAVLRELAAWRENEAHARDWPRAHVLPDDLLTATAVQSPAAAKDFRAIDGMPRGMPGDVVSNALAAVARGLALPENECPLPWGEDAAARRALKAPSDRLLAFIAAACAPHKIDPALVASRSDAETFVRRAGQNLPEGHPLSGGWRKSLIADFAL
jgi:ribonuclease D